MAITEVARFWEAGLGAASEQAGGGVALLVLGILGLVGVQPLLLSSIAVLVAGVALLVDGAMLSARYAQALSKAAPEAVNVRMFSGGMSSSLLAGAAGIVLGILAILNVATGALIGVALIAFGTALLFDYAARAHIRALSMVGAGASSEAERIARSAASTTDTASVLVAVGLITLGILVLAHMIPEVLPSAAFVGLGTYLVLEGAAASSWLMEVFALE